jgi:hypothetical protein
MSGASANVVPKDGPDWFQWVQSRLRLLERHRHAGPDIATTVQAEIFSAVASGWSISTCALVRAGDVVSFSATVQRTGTGLTSASDGNIGNSNIGTLQPEFRPNLAAPVTTTHTGFMATCYVDAAGLFTVSALPPSVPWNTNVSIALGGTWVAQKR